MKIPCCNNCGAPLRKMPKRQFAQCDYCGSGLMIFSTKQCLYTVLIAEIEAYQAELDHRSRRIQKTRGKEPIVGALLAFIYEFIVIMVWMLTSLSDAPHFKDNVAMIFTVCLIVAGTGAVFASSLGYLVGMIVAIFDDSFRPIHLRRVNLSE